MPDEHGTLIGQQIGVYRVVSLLGAGGMGEVYRARDTKLGRDVAIKVLPPMFTADRDRLARFEREARMRATLNHPHIGAIYGLEANMQRVGVRRQQQVADLVGHHLSEHQRDCDLVLPRGNFDPPIERVSHGAADLSQCHAHDI